MFGPLLAAGLFSSMAGSAIGAAQNNNNIRRQLAFQKAENQKTREYNMMLARYQNQENLAQWNRQNQYNLPEKQMQRLRQAGLNPDLMYSNGTVGNSMSSPEMTSGAPASPMDYSALGGMRTFGDVVTQTLNNEMQRAQIEAIKANTNKTKEETTGVILANENLTYKNLVDAATTGQKIEMENLNIDLGKSQLDLNEKEGDLLVKQFDEINSKIRLNEENLLLISSQAKLNEAQRKKVLNDIDRETALARGQLAKWMYENQESLARIGLINAQRKLSENELDEALITFSHRFYGIVADNATKDKTNEQLDIAISFGRMNNEKFSYQLASDRYRHELKNYNGNDIGMRFASQVNKFIIDGLLGSVGGVASGLFSGK